MQLLHPILAASGGSAAEVIIFLLILVGGWIYNAVESWRKRQQAAAPSPPPFDATQQLNKSVDLAKQRMRQEQLQRKQQVQQVFQQLTKKVKKTVKRQAAQAAPAAVKPIVTKARAVVDEPVIPIKPVAQRVSASALHTWLTPATLKQQFLLTEILNPPKALRPEI